MIKRMMYERLEILDQKLIWGIFKSGRRIKKDAPAGFNQRNISLFSVTETGKYIIIIYTN